MKTLRSLAIFTCVLSIGGAAAAQGIIKAGKAESSKGNFIRRKMVYSLTAGQLKQEQNQPDEKADDASLKKMVTQFNSNATIKGLHGKDSINSFRIAVKSYNDSSVASELATSLNKTSYVHFIAAGGISNIDDVRKATGNLALGIQFRLTDFQRVKNGPFKNWVDPHYLYLMFNTRTGNSSDTEILARTFLFPELHKRDFVLGYFWHLEKNNWGIEPLFEGSLSRYADSAKTTMFRTESFVFGSKFYRRFSVPINGDTIDAVVQLFPYYNMINVDPKYWNAFQTLMSPNGQDMLKPTWHSVGLQAMAQIETVTLFCNMKYVLNRAQDIANVDLKRFVYTIGSMITL